jgi:trans-2,3-dihydro-3-hydroxyanthranilate isomerase
MAHAFLLVDVFTEHAFSGNQLAVFCDAREIDPAHMQPFARELNFSETVFVLPPEDPANTARLRIFTPEAEVPFAGHPVIGTAFALDRMRDDLRNDEDLRFEVEAGVIQVRRYRSESGRLLQAVMNQRRPTFLTEMVSAEEVAVALGIQASEILITGLPCQVVSTGLPFHIVPVGSLDAMRSLRPSPSRLLGLGEKLGVSDICAFSFETTAPDATVHARMFAPSYGIPEDPATGSAAGCIGSYVVRHRAVPRASLTRLLVEQGVEMGRPARLHVEVHSEGDRICSVLVGGSAVVVGEGSLYEPDPA